MINEQMNKYEQIISFYKCNWKIYILNLKNIEFNDLSVYKIFIKKIK